MTQYASALHESKHRLQGRPVSRTGQRNARNVRVLSTVLLCAVLLVASAYFGDATALAQDGNLIRNPDFTLGTDSSGLPLYWTLFGPLKPLVSFEISNEQASVGDVSLKVIDNDATSSIGLRSHRVPVQPGQRLAVLVDVFVEAGQAMIYLDFHNAQGSRIEAHTAVAGQTTGWETISVNAAAPAGTDHATIILYSSVPNQGVIYFDNVRLMDASAQPITLAEREPTSREIGFRPDDGAIVLVNPPPLVWLPVAGATSYIVEFSPDPTFPVGKTERVEQIKLPLYTHSRALEPGTWYWRYSAVTNGGVVGPSQARSFVVREGLPELPLPSTEEWMERIPKEHPRIFVRPEQLDSLRQRINVRALSALFTDGHLASLLGVTLPPEPTSAYATGSLDIEVWREGLDAMTPSFNTLEELAFLYMMTGNERYGQEGKKLLLHLAAMNPSGPTSYRGGAPEVAMRMLYYLPRAYSWLYDTMTEEERDIVRHSARVRGTEAYSMIKALPFETSPYSSHPGRMLGFLGQLSIVFLGEIPEAEGWLEYVVQLMSAVYPAWGSDDGGYAEGNGYWAAYMNWVFDFLDAFNVATGIDFYKKPFFRNTGYFALYTLSPGTGQPFGDGTNQGIGSAAQAVMTHLAKVTQNPYFAWYVREVGQGQRSRSLTLLMQDSLPQAKVPADLPDARWFRDIGWVALHRSLETPKENIQFTFKSSPYGSVSHSHSDQNAFVLYAYGDALAVSSGYYPWSRSPHHENWTNQTRSKNSLLFDGRGQSTFDMTATGEVLGLFHSTLYDYTAADATTAYKNSNLQRFTRHVLYLRPDLFLLIDDVRSRNPQTVDWLLHSRFAIEWNQEKQSAHIEGRNSTLDVYMLTPRRFRGSVTDQYNIPPEVDSYQKEWHLTARLEERVDNVAIVSLLVPKKADADGPELVEASAEVLDGVVHVRMTYRTGGETVTEDIWVELPSAGEPTLGAVEAVAYDGAGNLVKALATGSTPSEKRGALRVTPEWSAAAAFSGETVELTIGRADKNYQWVALSPGEGVEVIIDAPFAPSSVLVNGESYDGWSYDATDGTVRVVW